MIEVVLISPLYLFNVENIVRTTEGFGVKRLSFVNSKNYDAQISRQNFSAEVVYYDNLNDFLKTRESDAYRFVSVEYREDAQSLWEFEHPQDPIYIFGSEMRSLEQRVLDSCENIVQIPTKGAIFLSSSVAIVLSDHARKNG